MGKTSVSDHKRKVYNSKKYKLRKKRRRKRFLMKLSLIIFGLIFIMCLVGITSSLFSLKTKRALWGVWTYDTVTTYQFDKQGKGNLILPEKSHPFTYLTDRKLLFLDFEEESLTDMIFRYSVNSDTLSFINNENGQEFILKKYE